MSISKNNFAIYDVAQYGKNYDMVELYVFLLEYDDTFCRPYVMINRFDDEKTTKQTKLVIRSLGQLERISKLIQYAERYRIVEWDLQ